MNEFEKKEMKRISDLFLSMVKSFPVGSRAEIKLEVTTIGVRVETYMLIANKKD